MLAFPQMGDRRNYFQGKNVKTFGPRHQLEEWLRRGKNGNKGVTWFENMETTFTLPTAADASGDDAFMPVRHMWE